MAVSIMDVAKLANVSISTVSRVLNRRDLVNKQTRARVESAIAQLGYRPNAFARGLMLRKSELVGLVLPDLHGEFYSEIIRGANQRARQLGYNLVVSSAHDPDDARNLLQGILSRSFLDGVAVMISELTDHLQELLADFQRPIVLLDADVNDGIHDSVIIDQREGALALMHHLALRCKMKRIIFIGGLKTNVDTLARHDAYRQTLGEFGLPYRSEDVYHLDYEYETAYKLASSVIDTWPGAGHCVFAANDEMASGVIDAATVRGVRVPEDLAVVGFDDTRIARMTRPPLTTVRVPMSDMGAQAVELLCERITDADRPAQRVALHPELVVRHSCGSTSQPA